MQLSLSRTSLRRIFATAETGLLDATSTSRICLSHLGRTQSSRYYATAPATAGSLASLAAQAGLRLPADYVPPTQPPSARLPDQRRSQLLRTYTSLIRSTPLMLFFQHNNLTAAEWAALRRELRLALAAVSPTPSTAKGEPAPTDGVAELIRLQVVRTRLFGVALKLVEFYNPEAAAEAAAATSAPGTKIYTHDLSVTAHSTLKALESNGGIPPGSAFAQLQPLLVGPLVLLTLPVVSPAHLAAALRILAPTPGQNSAFPAPSRKKNPGYYEPAVQSALQKLLLVGGRVEGRVFDGEGVRWVGGITGGVDSLRAQLVNMLQSLGMGLVGALEGQGRSLWMTMEGRRGMLEDQEKGQAKEG